MTAGYVDAVCLNDISVYNLRILHRVVVSPGKATVPWVLCWGPAFFVEPLPITLAHHKHATV